MIDSSMPSAQPAIERLEDQPSLVMGITGGVIAMLVGAILWGAITFYTGYQIGYVAIGLGFLVGIAIKFFGRGKSGSFGLSAAILALIGCVVGNLLVYSAIIAREEGVSLLRVFFLLLRTPSAAIEVFTLAFDFMDILFYALAAYTGFSTAMDIPAREAVKPGHLCEHRSFP